MLLLSDAHLPDYMMKFHRGQCICGRHIRHICEIGFSCYYIEQSIVFSSAYLHQPKMHGNDQERFQLYIGNPGVCCEKIKIGHRQLISWYLDHAREIFLRESDKTMSSRWRYSRIVQLLSQSIHDYLDKGKKPRFCIRGQYIY